MEFDETNQEFVLNAEDMSVLLVPSELGRWPLRDVGQLIDEVTATQNRLAGTDETQFPHGSRRHEIHHTTERHKVVILQISHLVARHAALDDDTLQKLLEQ